jgi:hypothetical protein
MRRDEIRGFLVSCESEDGSEAERQAIEEVYPGIVWKRVSEVEVSKRDVAELIPLLRERLGELDGSSDARAETKVV